jgi:bifunctional polynucleotide phosphatase/kinase
MLTKVTPSFYAYAGDRPSDCPKHGNKIFATDMDGTIIRTRRGVFPKDQDDWALLPNRISTLKRYINHGFIIVIFTNQKRNPNVMTIKAQNVLKKLIEEGINPWVFVSTKDDKYRKPNIGMWEYFVENFGCSIDYEGSLYVGDAAGRPQDHSNADIGFTENIGNGIEFYVPEEIFTNPTNILIPDTQAMFILVGLQGVGKSTYYHNNLEPKGWYHANQDTLGTYNKVLKEIENNLKLGKSVCVDATNPDLSKRQDYIILAKKYKVPTLIIYFVGNTFNSARGDKKVHIIALHTYYKNLQEPSEELEGVPVVEYI